MKRIAYVVFAVMTLGCGAPACKKAHDAGNDSMKASHGAVVASSDGQVATVREALASSAPLAARAASAGTGQ
ncbi:hypothetical protein [Paraburkholderia lycopersici]|uniref:Lipoprotein n=1 Tax=Paraburkholderia lycopersici TaxID=416944 RepID=A0A1G7BZB0_9BURK|nr:hypothetical protein [Paraburkholderia lycopersici]SDE32428.1 hypothetical protein SAMN05421548_14211 [Paraburkholderia lycopersici]